MNITLWLACADFKSRTLGLFRMEPQGCLSPKRNMSASCKSLVNTMLSDPGPNPDTSQTALASPSASRGPEDPNLSAAQEYNPQAPSYYHQANTAASNGSNGQWLHADTDLFPENSSPSIESRGEATGLHDERKESEGGGNFESNLRLERFAQRSVQLLNLADGVSHGDITAAVRGGLLLEVLLRPRERAARVSFVHERDAAAFLDHSREHGLYIKNKRVAAKWSDQQFVLAGHVAHNISRGATRNFVIRGRDPNHTEETIREDLRHIHNLYVVKVEIAKNDCFISTNSVHNAMFARTCMMSRVEYKGSRIEWSADECAQPLSMPPAKPRSHGFQPKPNSSSSASTSMNPMVNRFQLLDLTENDDEDESESS
ncbi:hypothetical protein ACJ41O_011400 [Fusarium nematophilum]